MVFKHRSAREAGWCRAVNGWQLSQGERSRVFMARALLQGARLVVMDEPLATLDPENLRQCLECVFRRCGTLMVVAHI